MDDRPGSLFSDVYSPRGEASRDDPRMRRRLSALFSSVRSRLDIDFQGPITGRLGVDIPYSSYGWDWTSFFANAALSDLLNSITIIYKTLVDRSRTGAARAWLSGVQEIFDQQNTAYRMEDGGGVRFRVDEAMVASTLSTVGTLNTAGLGHIASLLDTAMTPLDSNPSDYAEAIRRTFFATEELFKLNFAGAQRLVAFEIDNRLKPEALALAVDNKAAADATPKLIDAFKDWVSACHDYRHAKGEEEPKQPPAGLGIAIVTQGFSWIRWLAPLKGK